MIARIASVQDPTTRLDPGYKKLFRSDTKAKEIFLFKYFSEEPKRCLKFNRYLMLSNAISTISLFRYLVSVLMVSIFLLVTCCPPHITTSGFIN